MGYLGDSGVVSVCGDVSDVVIAVFSVVTGAVVVVIGFVLAVTGSALALSVCSASAEISRFSISCAEQEENITAADNITVINSLFKIFPLFY